MATKTKPFDCVEMKRHAQAQIMAEYETRKGEFPSYWEFLQSKFRESAWQKAIWEKFQGRGTKSG